MKIITSGITPLPTGFVPGYIVTPLSPQSEWDKIPRKGRPYVMIDRENGGANVLYDAWSRVPSLNAVDELDLAWTFFRIDISKVRAQSPLSQVGCWSVPGTQETNDFADRRINNRFAWPVMARCDFALLNGYISDPVPAFFWVKGCARIAIEEFSKPVCYGIQPLYVGGEHDLELIDPGRFEQHCRDVKDSGATMVWYWGQWRQNMEAGRRPDNSKANEVALYGQFVKHHLEKLAWSKEALAAWCDGIDKQYMGILRKVTR